MTQLYVYAAILSSMFTFNMSQMFIERSCNSARREEESSSSGVILFVEKLGFIFNKKEEKNN